jgi:ABC-type molybdate transport system substrate-binding protein
LTTPAKATAAAFVAYLTSPQAHNVFIRYGFTDPSR